MNHEKALYTLLYAHMTKKNEWSFECIISYFTVRKFILKMIIIKYYNANLRFYIIWIFYQFFFATKFWHDWLSLGNNSWNFFFMRAKFFFVFYYFILKRTFSSSLQLFPTFSLYISSIFPQLRVRTSTGIIVSFFFLVYCNQQSFHRTFVDCLQLRGMLK